MSMRCWWFQDAMGIGFKAGAQPCEMLIFFLPELPTAVHNSTPLNAQSPLIEHAIFCILTGILS